MVARMLPMCEHFTKGVFCRVTSAPSVVLLEYTQKLLFTRVA